MNKECLYCKRPYVPNKDHPHYCDNCVKFCPHCGELKVVWAFNFKPNVTKEQRLKKITKDVTQENCHNCQLNIDARAKKSKEISKGELPLFGPPSVSKSETVKKLHKKLHNESEITNALSDLNKTLERINSWL